MKNNSQFSAHSLGVAEYVKEFDIVTSVLNNARYK